MSAEEVVGAKASARLVASWGPTAAQLVRHDLADLVRGLGARSAGRRVLVADTREDWQEIADDVGALARHDEQRCQYTAAQRAARAMGRDDVGEAIDVLCDLTGETVEEWSFRVVPAMGVATRTVRS